VQDFSERKQSKEELTRSEARYRGIVDATTAFIARGDLEGRFIFLNEAYRQLLGKPFEELLGHSFLDFVHEDDRNDVLAVFRHTLESPLSRARFDCRMLTPDGSAWVAWDGNAILDGRGVMTEVQAVGHEVTQRRAAEESLRVSLDELRGSEEKLRLLAQHQTAIREEERRRLGFDLHDDVCQELVGVAILVESLRQRLQPCPPAEDADFTRIAGYLNEVVEHLRLLARDLRPMLLPALGLEGALRALAEGMSSDATRVIAEFRTPIPRLGEEIELGIYRIAQEALGNATRHAAARAIVVTVDVADHILHLEVRDDGCGFTLSNRQRSPALGLLGMETRAKALGGTFKIWSEPGNGTAVSLHCPFDGHAATA
jgi:two-component system sensor histidine kinase UhpB